MKKSIEEYTQEMRERYGRMTGRKAKSKLLDELINITGWERKHANKVLLGLKRISGTRTKQGATTRQKLLNLHYALQISSAV